VETGTYTKVPDGTFLFSMLDIDGGSRGTEKVTIDSSVQQYYTTGSDCILDIAGDVSGGLSFTAQEGTTWDNPKNFPDLTQDQMNCAVTALTNKSQFDVTFKIIDGKLDKGRSLYFAGWSPIAPAKIPQCIPYAEWSLCNSNVTVHSNLGGLGEDEGDENLRFSNVAEGIDLLVTNSSLYYANNPKKNRLEDCIGRIQVGVSDPGEATLLFQFVKTGTNTKVTNNKFMFSLLDIDSGSRGTEYVTLVSGYKSYFTTEGTVLTKEVDGDKVLFHPPEGELVDNPKLWPELTQDQKNLIVTALTEDSEVEVNFKIVDGKSNKGRSLYFAPYYDTEICIT